MAINCVPPRLNESASFAQKIESASLDKTFFDSENVDILPVQHRRCN
jgi:hypothetical protein